MKEKKQHTKPCDGCPFARSTQPGALGGSSAMTYIGQANGPFWLPCHSACDFSDPNWKDKGDTPQCIGAATFRANLGLHFNTPALLDAIPDKKAVFATNAEFLAHHMGITLKDAEDWLGDVTPQELTLIEYMRSGTQPVLVPRKREL